MKKRDLGLVGLGALLSLLFWAGRPSRSGVKAEVLAYFTPEDAVTTALRQAIDAAQREVVVAMYTFTNRDLGDALIRAKNRGVMVRVLIDANQAGMRYSQIPELKRRGVEVVEVELGRTGNNIDIRYHNKFAVIDQLAVVTGSFNWTTQADRENFENLLLIKSAKLAEIYQATFDRHWKRFSGSP